ncbi:MAG: DUF504 domain-containing protein [Myxococcales bacterium]|nr:DUF504 domain-containing protein [Myxococcales bacterium]
MPSRRERRALRPIQDVVGRLRHDPAFAGSRFAVVYEERFSGEREAPLADFVAGGEIPWHRIQALKAGALVVWDRRTRVDLVFGSGESGAADHPAILAAGAAVAEAAAPPRGRGRGHRGPGRRGEAAEGARSGAALAGTRRVCWRFDAGADAWVAVDARVAPPVVAESLLVVTYNVLVDLHEAAAIYSERRVAAALALLCERDADVVALQEVTPRFWAALLAEPWVRERYYVSSGTGFEGLDPYGQALLCRWPLALDERRLSPRKALLCGRLDLGGRPLLVVAIHLTSNFRGDAAARRAEQLAVVARRLGEGDAVDALILGDVNFGDDEAEAGENQRLAAAGLVDAWRALHPDDPGFTFDPAANSLAARMSRSGRAARYDRVLLRSPGAALAPIEVTRFGDRPFAVEGDEARYASDHCGLAALLEVSGAAAPAVIEGPPVHTSALVVLPPSAIWPAIQAIRAELDPSYGRWMPHINLIYGFVDEAAFAGAAAAIAVRLRGFAPFEVRLGPLRRFDHRGSTTLWVEPICAPPGALCALQAEVEALFPGCREQRERGDDGYTPHLTIARVSGDEATIAAIVERVRGRLGAGVWTVDAVHLIRRRGAEPFAVRHSLSLGTDSKGPLATPPPGARWASPTHRVAAEALAAACAESLTGPLRVHLVGSARLGVAAEDGDLDLVCVHADPAATDEAHARIVAALDRRGLGGARSVVGGGILALRGELDGVAFDLLFARVPAVLVERDPRALSAETLEGLDEASRRALLGCVDADALIHMVGAAAEPFRGALARIRAWSRARGLEGGAWGLLGGYTWAILVAWATRGIVLRDMSSRTCDFDGTTPWVLVRHFFETFAAWSSGAPLVADAPPPEGVSGRAAPWPIFTPTAPAFNSARGLLPTTLALIEEELRRGREIVSDGRDEAAALAELCAPPVAETRSLELVVRAADRRALAAARGLVDGRALALLRALEAAGAALRPRGWVRDGEADARALVGLRGGDPAAIWRAVDDALAGLRGAPGWPEGATIEAVSSSPTLSR